MRDLLSVINLMWYLLGFAILRDEAHCLPNSTPRYNLPMMYNHRPNTQKNTLHSLEEEVGATKALETKQLETCRVSWHT